MPPSAAGETVLSPAGDSRLLASPTHSAVTMASMSSWSGPVSTAPASAPPPPVTPSKANRVLSSISFRVPGMSRSSSLRMKDLGSGAGFMHSDKRKSQKQVGGGGKGEGQAGSKRRTGDAGSEAIGIG